MNTATLIFTLILFGLALFFAFLYLVEKFKASQRHHRQQIIKLTKKVKLIENKVEMGGSSGDKKPAPIMKPNVFENMEANAAKKLKTVVSVNDKNVRVGEP